MIKGFLFERFKGFDSAVLWIEQITTLIGTNASGKSNAIEGMQILSELAHGRDLNVIFDGTKNGESAIRGGAKGCCRFGAQSFTLGAIVNWNDTHDLFYRVEIGVTNRIAIKEESLSLVENGKLDVASGTLVFRTKAATDSGDISVVYHTGKKGNRPQLQALRSMSILSQMKAKLPSELENYDDAIQKIGMVQDALTQIFILDPIPSEMRGYGRIGETSLRRNCNNISAVLYALRKSPEWETFSSVVKELPENEIREIDFIKTQLNDVILIQKEEVGKTFMNIDASRLSDGTLRCIAALAAVMSEPEGSVIAIEEVDNGIHPSRAKKLVDALSDIARRRNIDLILTTHNVTVLNGLNKKGILGVAVVYRDEDTQASRIIPFVDIRNQAGILASGGIGDAMETEIILRRIKEEDDPEPFVF